MSITILSGLVLVAAWWLYSVYVSLIQKKNKVKEALASIDVQLKKRYDLIPNVLFIANKFMEHERSLIEEITKLRTEALKLQGEDTISQKMQLDKDIQSKMSQLMVSVENYPQLKSDNTMVQAMETYSEVEEHIAASRRFYNASVLDLKNAVEIWPSSMFAQSLGIKSDLPYFEVTDEKERQPVNASDYLK